MSEGTPITDKMVEQYRDFDGQFEGRSATTANGVEVVIVKPGVSDGLTQVRAVNSGAVFRVKTERLSLGRSASVNRYEGLPELDDLYKADMGAWRAQVESYSPVMQNNTPGTHRNDWTAPSGEKHTTIYRVAENGEVIGFWIVHMMLLVNVLWLIRARLGQICSVRGLILPCSVLHGELDWRLRRPAHRVHLKVHLQTLGNLHKLGGVPLQKTPLRLRYTTISLGM